MVTVLVDGDVPYGPIQIEVAEIPRADIAEVYGDEATRWKIRENVTKLPSTLFAVLEEPRTFAAASRAVEHFDDIGAPIRR